MIGAAVLTGERTSTFAADPGVLPAGVPASASPQRDEFGVVGRKIRDLVAEVRGARRLPSLTEEFVALASDPTAYVDSRGDIFFADIGLSEGPEQTSWGEDAGAQHEPSADLGSSPVAASADVAGAEVAEGVLPPTGNAFALHSRPGSTKTIYLDFDGATVSGTQWNNDYGIPVKTVPPYDTDANPGSFSATEQQIIRDVWQGVSEDFAAFDVNVTTQRPPTDDAFTRSSLSDPTYGVIAVITPQNWLCGSGCSGVAYLNVFSRSTLYNSPAWVFPPSGYSAVGIANIVSHEVGHNLSLSHDGVNGGSEYYGGAGVWGPIMGSTGRQYVQWSKGEYSTANNSEDDVTLIASYTGFASDSSTSTANAVVVAPGANVTTPDDVISNAADVDYYAIDVTNSWLQVTLGRSSISPNFAPQLVLTNSSGGELLNRVYVGAGAPPIFFSSAVPKGRYYLQVRGAPHPTDFTTYGSLGFYNVSVFRPLDPSAPGSLTLTASGDRVLTASWSPSTSETGTTVTYEAQLCESSVVCGAATSTSATSAPLVAPSGTGSFTARITAVDSSGRRSSAVTSPLVAVLSRPVAPPVQKLRWDETAGTVTIGWGSATSFAPVTATSATLTLRNRTTNEVRTFTNLDVNGGQRVEPVGTWAGATVEASLTALTGSVAPWNQSDPSAVASVLTARAAAPSAPPVSITPRGAAPSAAGTGGGGGRGAAPQA